MGLTYQQHFIAQLQTEHPPFSAPGQYLIDFPSTRGVIALMGSGCATIVSFLLVEMVSNMDESFLMTPSWSKVRDRMRKAGEVGSSC